MRACIIILGSLFGGVYAIDNCGDDPDFLFEQGETPRTCNWVGQEKLARCLLTQDGDPLLRSCPASCGTCGTNITESSVATDASCYLRTEDVAVSFTNVDPLPDDWIGVYPADNDFDDLRVGDMWIYACGSENCRATTISDNMMLTDLEGWSDNWPLDTGTYIVHLLRDTDEGPFTSIAHSNQFEVRSADEGCESETSAPTGMPVTSSPTPLPKAWIATAKICQAVNQSLAISYFDPDPQPDDWIGVYKATSDISDLGVPAMWAWTDSSDSGTYVLGEDDFFNAGEQTWPLSPLVYRAFILRNSSMPYEVVAVSQFFSINPLYMDCAEEYEPTAAPSLTSNPTTQLSSTMAPTLTPSPSLQSPRLSPLPKYITPTPFPVAAPISEVPSLAPSSVPSTMPTSSPSSAPSMLESLSPSIFPSSSPSTKLPSLQPSVTVIPSIAVKNCIPFNEDIDVIFENPKPQDDDWIGIYPDSSDSENLLDPLFWLWTCGTQLCQREVSNGDVTFGSSRPVEEGTIDWPLPPGLYKVFILRNGLRPFNGYAEATFMVPSGKCITSSPTMSQNPSMTPSNRPSGSYLPSMQPSTVPSSHPTPPNMLRTDSLVYSKGEPIVVSYVHNLPMADDWIGIYRSDVDPFRLTEGELWSYACGTKTCRTAEKDVSMEGEVTFGSDDASWTQHWPLEPGSYMVFVIREGANPWRARLGSEPFVVIGDE